MIYTSAARQAELEADGLENSPFFVWENFADGKTLTGTLVNTGGERENATTGTTYDRWRPIVSGVSTFIQVDLGAATDVSFCGIAAHNTASLGGTFRLDYSSLPDSGFVSTPQGVITPTDNNPIAFRFTTITARYWRIIFGGLTMDAPLSVGVALLGHDIVMPRQFYQGFAPILTPTEVDHQANVSVGNELLGASVIGRGSTLDVSMQNIPDFFMRSAEWLGFQTAFNDGEGFFMGWRPDKYPEDVHYGWRQGSTIRPANSGPQDLMSFQLSTRVYNAQPV